MITEANNRVWGIWVTHPEIRVLIQRDMIVAAVDDSRPIDAHTNPWVSSSKTIRSRAIRQADVYKPKRINARGGVVERTH